MRAGADIAFLGGMVNYILSNEKDFREYVLAYTNASMIVSEDFRDTEDLDGLFSGYDPETEHVRPGELGVRTARRRQGQDEGESHADRETASGLEQESHGPPVPADVPRDPTLQHPRCVYQMLKRHYARYTPEVVERVCGVPQDKFLEVCEAWTANSGRERTTALVYSVGWTQHSVGVQYIRTGAIIQLLLGNMGRPGGGVMALRGHASIQGSTDIPTLFNLLPGYLPMPHHSQHETFRQWVDEIRHPEQKGFWANAESYAVSLLKAYCGDAATAENDWGYGWLPRLTGDHGTYQQVLDMIDGKIKGYFLLGQNPAVGSAHGKAQRLGMANLDWLVVRDLYMIESATFWKDGPEVATGEIVPEECRTEVFFMPAASHVEKEGTFTQTQRMLQWREKAVEPPGDCRSELWFFYHLGRLVRERLAGSTAPRDQGILNLTWDYPTARRARRRAERRGRAARRSTGTTSPPARRCPASPRSRPTAPPRAAAGSTPACSPTASTRPPAASPAPSRTGWPASGAGPGRPTGARSTTAPPPTRTASPGRSARSTSGGTPRPASGPATTCRTSRRPSRRRTGRRRARPASRRSPATTRSSCRATARAGCTRRAA